MATAVARPAAAGRPTLPASLRRALSGSARRSPQEPESRVRDGAPRLDSRRPGAAASRRPAPGEEGSPRRAQLSASAALDQQSQS